MYVCVGVCVCLCDSYVFTLEYVMSVFEVGYCYVTYVGRIC